MAPELPTEPIPKCVVYDCSVWSMKEIADRIGESQILEKLPYSESIRFIKHTVDGHCADPPQFCNVLTDYLRENGSFHFCGGTKVLDFDIDSKTKKVSRLYTNGGVLNIDNAENENVIVVIAAGSWTPILCRKLGLFVPVYPLKVMCMTYMFSIC